MHPVHHNLHLSNHPHLCPVYPSALDARLRCLEKVRNQQLSPKKETAVMFLGLRMNKKKKRRIRGLNWMKIHPKIVSQTLMLKNWKHVHGKTQRQISST
jgi:hypothetical protein